MTLASHNAWPHDHWCKDGTIPQLRRQSITINHWSPSNIQTDCDRTIDVAWRLAWLMAGGAPTVRMGRTSLSSQDHFFRRVVNPRRGPPPTIQPLAKRSRYRYSHMFVCLSDHLSSKVPSKFMKLELTTAGLGEKRISFYGKFRSEPPVKSACLDMKVSFQSVNVFFFPPLLSSLLRRRQWLPVIPKWDAGCISSVEGHRRLWAAKNNG